MNLAIVAAVFPVIFLGELPDKTMFASLVLASKGKPAAVWAGASAGFAVHVAIAVAIGGAISLVPHRLVDLLAGLLFLVGAAISLRESGTEEEEEGERAAAGAGHGRTMATAFGVIFIAEWGDLTQVLTATMAARYRDPLSVGVGALAALVLVAALAATAGSRLAKVPVRVVRVVTAVVLVILAAVSFYGAATGSAAF